MDTKWGEDTSPDANINRAHYICSIIALLLSFSFLLGIVWFWESHSLITKALTLITPAFGLYYTSKPKFKSFIIFTVVASSAYMSQFIS